MNHQTINTFIIIVLFCFLFVMISHLYWKHDKTEGRLEALKQNVVYKDIVFRNDDGKELFTIKGEGNIKIMTPEEYEAWTKETEIPWDYKYDKEGNRYVNLTPL